MTNMLDRIDADTCYHDRAYTEFIKVGDSKREPNLSITYQFSKKISWMRRFRLNSVGKKCLIPVIAYLPTVGCIEFHVNHFGAKSNF